MPSSESLEFDFAPGEKLSVDSKEEFTRWINAENKALAWLVGSEGNNWWTPAYVGHMRARYRQLFGQLNVFAQNQYAQAGEPTGRRQAFEVSINIVRNEGLPPTSLSPNFAYVMQIYNRALAESGELWALNTAAAALFILTGDNAQRHVNPGALDHVAAWQGIVSLQLMRVGASVQLPEAVTLAFQQEVERGRAAVATREAELNSIRTGHSELTQQVTRETSEQLRSTEERAVAALTRIQDTEIQFRTQMQLRAPVEYWTSKGEEHAVKSGTYRKALKGWLPVWILSLLAVYGLGLWLIESLSTPGELNVPLAFYITGFIAVLTSGALWHIRVLVRLFMSHKHLGIDAEERAAMLKTFLALSADQKVADTDKALVLAPIFRPTSDGIVKDDGAPAFTLPAMLASLLDGGGGKR